MYKKKAQALSEEEEEATTQDLEQHGRRQSESSQTHDFSTGVAASASASLPSTAAPQDDDYPPSVQELILNGFDAKKVWHAYSLLGDNMDDLIAFLLSN